MLAPVDDLMDTGRAESDALRDSADCDPFGVVLADCVVPPLSRLDRLGSGEAKLTETNGGAHRVEASKRYRSQC